MSKTSISFCLRNDSKESTIQGQESGPITCSSSKSNSNTRKGPILDSMLLICFGREYCTTFWYNSSDWHLQQGACKTYQTHASKSNARWVKASKILFPFFYIGIWIGRRDQLRDLNWFKKGSDIQNRWITPLLLCYAIPSYIDEGGNNELNESVRR